ncbi:hypothetical protein BC332_05660 [Capsicum chinense]|nr:hypothetical protein BC332_05660 [Capsicum chinense]
MMSLEVPIELSSLCGGYRFTDLIYERRDEGQIWSHWAGKAFGPPNFQGAFLLDRGLPDMSLHLDKWSTKEEIDVLDFNKVINTTAFVLHSSTHDKESAATYRKGSNKGLATWNYPQ